MSCIRDILGYTKHLHESAFDCVVCNDDIAGLANEGHCAPQQMTDTHPVGCEASAIGAGFEPITNRQRISAAEKEAAAAV